MYPGAFRVYWFNKYNFVGGNSISASKVAVCFTAQFHLLANPLNIAPSIWQSLGFASRVDFSIIWGKAHVESGGCPKVVGLATHGVSYIASHIAEHTDIISNSSVGYPQPVSKHLGSAGSLLLN